MTPNMSQLSIRTTLFIIFFYGPTTCLAPITPKEDVFSIISLQNKPHEEITTTEETITTIDTEQQGRAYILQYYPQKEIDHMEILDSAEDMQSQIKQFNNYVEKGNPVMNFRDYIALKNYESYGFITINNEALRTRFPHQTFEMANTLFKLAGRLGRYNVIYKPHLETGTSNPAEQKNRVSATLWRGEARLKSEMDDILKAKEFYNTDRFMSYSTNKGTATRFMTVRKTQFRNKIRVLYELKAKKKLHYLDMSDVNYHHSKQEEVILFPGTKFTIIDSKMKKLRPSGEKYLHVRLLYTQKISKDEWRQNHYQILSKYWDMSEASSTFTSLAEKPQPPVPAKRRSLEMAETSECLSGPSTSRSKRDIKTCPITWADLDKVSANKVQDLEAITFDSKKVLNYVQHSKNPEKKKIILALAKQTRDKDSNRIVGEHQEEFEQVLDAGNYGDYIKCKRISMLKKFDFMKSKKISSKCKFGLITAAGKIQLVQGSYNILKEISEGDPDAVYSIAAFGYSFASQKIETAIMKKYFQTVSALTIAEQINLTPKTGLVRELFASKPAVMGVRAGVGVAISIFNVVDVARSSWALIKCSTEEDLCSAKEVRDHVASITLSGVSLITTVASSVAEMTGPIGIFIGLGIMVAGMIYNGISTEIEYSNRYSLTTNEKWSTFLYTALLQGVPDGVQQLTQTSEKVNTIMSNSWIKLNNLPENIVGYAMGFGKEVIGEKVIFPGNYFGAAFYPLPVIQTGLGVQPHTSVKTYKTHCEIDMSGKSKDTIMLSRVLPEPIKDATMVCLPKFSSDSLYDPGSGETRLGADYHCDNAAVIINDRRNQTSVRDKTIFYDFEHILDGKITGSHEMNNIFYLSNGTSLIFSGRNVVNYFHFTSHYAYQNKMIIDVNSTNIIDLRKFEHDNIIIHFQSYTSIDKNSLDSLNENRYFFDNSYKNMMASHIAKGVELDVLQVAFISNNDTKSILYVNSDATKTDTIACSDGSGKETVIINSGGSENGFDLITNCENVILSPNTVVKDDNGDELHYTIYIAEGQNDKNTSSHIRVKKGRIMFTGVSLFQDVRQIVYQVDGDFLIVDILTGKSVHELYIEDYWNKTTNTSSYVLVDKYNSVIVPKIVSSKNHFVTSFELYHKMPGNLITNDEIQEYYNNITANDKNYTIFGTLINQSGEVFRIGTAGRDVLENSRDTIFIKGGEGSDVYAIISSGPDHPFAVEINNESQDKFLDILLVSYGIENTKLIRVNDDLNIIFTDYVTIPNIRLLNYFEDTRFRHIAIKNPHTLGVSTWIPFNVGNELLYAQFYSHSSDDNIFLLDLYIIEQNPYVVVNLEINNIALYQREGDLLLTSKKGHYFHSIMLIFIDYFEDRESWSNLRLYSHHKGQISYVHLDLSTLSNNYQHVYPNFIDEYVVNFTEYKEVSHNQVKNDDQFVSVEEEDEKIGVVLFKNRSLSDLECTTENQNLVFTDSISQKKLVLINWLANEKSWISIFEFENGLEHTLYRLLSIFPKRTSMQNVINIYCAPADIVLQLAY